MATYNPAPVVYHGVREGERLTIPVPPAGQAAQLPPVCVKCGAPATNKPLQKTFYWHQPALYLIIILSPLIYVIVAMIVRKSIKVAVPLCFEHAKRRGIAVTVAWVLPLVGIADAFILPSVGVNGGIVALITASFLLAGIVIWAIVSNPIKPRSIDKFSGVFTGCCEIFLRQFSDRMTPQPSAAAPQFIVTDPRGPLPPPPPIA